MKRFVICLLIFLSAVVSTNAQTATDAAELTRLLSEFLAGAGRNDAAIHDRFWADDLIYTRSSGVRTNKEEIMKGVRSATAPKPGDPVTVYAAEEIQIRQYGDAAVVVFRLVGNTTKNDGTKTVINNFNTGTFIKRKGKWQVVAWQSTIIPDPKAAAQTSDIEAKPAALASPQSGVVQQAPPAGSRTYLKGSRGGCYYLSPSGTKVYVDHKFCN